MKPYLGGLLLAILLLFIQANADLALPDYMSRIVNVGIQQGGIEKAVPLVVSPDTFGQLLLFMSSDDADTVRSAYQLSDANDDRVARLTRPYGGITADGVYVITEEGMARIDELEPPIARALIVVGGLAQATSNPAAAAAMASQLGIDLSTMAGAMTGDTEETAPIDPTNPAAAIAAMPESVRMQVVDAVSGRLEAMGQAAVTAAGAAQVKAEYLSLGMSESRIQSRYTLQTGGIMLLLTLLSAFSAVMVGYVSARIAAGLTRDLRLGVFERVQNFAGPEFDKFSTASLITRSTNDVMQIQMVTVMMIRMVFFAPIIGVGGVLRALNKNSDMWWVIAAAVGVMSILIVIVYKIAVPKFKLMQKLVDRLNLVSRESLSGMMVIRAFNMEHHEEDRFDKANTELTDTTLFVNRVMVVMMPIMMLIMNGLSLFIIWVGAHQIAESAMQVGDMMAFLQYTMQIVFAFIMLSMMFIMLPRAAVSADRIADVLETEPTIRDPEQPAVIGGDFSPSVEFRNVSFRYPGGTENAICNVSFTAEPGKTTAFIGATGSGKSTVVNLIPRFYDVTEGEVLVGGTDVREVTQHDLRDQIGCVPQRATLFSGTIASNLRFADEDASDETLTDAVAIAQAQEFVESRAEGMEAEISQGGANVSGGQKQRIAIARALVKQAPIYLFDDSFSALDLKTDARLRRALKSRTTGSTVILVSQRVSTIMNADQIIVLDEGTVAGKGTHDELMASCDVYREIATSQLTEEELS